MRIGMVLDSSRSFPPDIRVEKECRALSEAGHQLFILTRRLRESEAETENLQAIGAIVMRSTIVARRERPLEALISTVATCDLRWLRHIAVFVRHYRIEVLHVHDSTLLPTALRAARKLAVPVVADLHENMPAMKRAYRSVYPLLKRAFWAIVWNYQRMRRVEARSLKRCIRAVVVVPEAAERLYGYGVHPNRVVVVSNTEDETTFKCDSNVDNAEVLATFADYWTASYIGGIGPHRGLDTTLRAVRRIMSAVDKFMLLIVGADETTRSWINREAEELGIGKAVTIVGWQPFTKVSGFVLASDVCLVPHNDTEHTQTTIPHKLFQYMICGKPVLVSDCRPLARIVSQAESGRIFKADSSESLAKELIWMHDHPVELKKMGQNGRRAALGEFSWRHDASRLVNMYIEISEEIQNTLIRSAEGTHGTTRSR
jgi:glycosyltransferase involved in cell wall biosynthesis